MAENKILPWAQTGTANVLSDSDYAADVASGGLYGDGVKTGQASSKQANKTWRQATAPGSGLAQFLVDNLSVDVTDADTPSTFSTRIANAVLKLAQISPFNQSWATATGGYRKYAIVSDSSGNFWVSTADQNTTVPGADGAKWQSLFNGYATQSWADGRYARLSGGNSLNGTQTVTNGDIVSKMLNGSTAIGGLCWGGAAGGSIPGRGTTGTNGPVGATLYPVEVVGSYVGGRLQVQGYGQRADADFRLNSDGSAVLLFGGNQVAYVSDVTEAVSTKANLSGGNTFSGNQVTQAKYDSGTLHWGASWTSVIEGMSGGSSNGDCSFSMWAQILDGVYTAGILSLNGFKGRKDFRFNEDGNIFTPLGTVALESDISNLQNQINGKQPSGDYVIHSEFPCNLSGNGWQKLPSGLIIQWGQNASGAGTYSFPTTFPNGCFAVVSGNTDAQGSYVDNAFAYAVNNSQFYIATKASNTGTVTGFPDSWFALGH